MAQQYLPLRWESTGNQWWCASPIDWVAANGHYELVRELLHLDTNLFIKLTSLRRIRRLETVWDDDAQFIDAPKCRSAVARKLLHDCDAKNTKNSLIKAGYGGWLLYTAASAGDVGFVHEMLERDPLLVFGEGEYGVTDVFYAAARGKSDEVFRMIFENAVSPRCLGEEERESGNASVFRWEVMKRAVLAAARGGSLEMLKELIGDEDVLAYRDCLGSTVLHAASGRGQVEIVKALIASFNIIESTDNQGSTALHVAAFHGHLPTVEALISASPSLSSFKNQAGDTFLHMAIAGFRTQAFRRLDRQMELMKKLIYGNILNIENIINIANGNGRTALHFAVIFNMQYGVVEALITVPSIKLNIEDVDGMTPLDLLSQRPHSLSSEILIKLLVLAGGMARSKGKSAIDSQFKVQCSIGISPGTSFRISDAEIILYTGIGASEVSERTSSCSSIGKSELPLCNPIEEDNEHTDKKKALRNVKRAARSLRILIRWLRRKEKKVDDEAMIALLKKWSEPEETLTSLRQKFSNPHSSLKNTEETFLQRSSFKKAKLKNQYLCFGTKAPNGLVTNQRQCRIFESCVPQVS